MAIFVGLIGHVRWANAIELEDLIRRVDARWEGTDASASDAARDEWRQLAQLLRMIEDSKPAGRHRFILPGSQARSRLQVGALRDKLEAYGVLSELESRLQKECDAIEAALQQDQSLDASEKLRQRWRSHALHGLLQSPTRSRSSAAKQDSAFPWDQVRGARSAENFPWGTWGPGRYSVATTPNVSIRSRAEVKPTAEMAEACEIAYAIWTMMFAPPERATGDAQNSPSNPEPFRVVLFRDRDAYLKTLKAIEPRIRASTGYYSPQHRLSFFYWDGSKSFATLVHELTHQFFEESLSYATRFDADRSTDFWVIEGVALYMESLSMRTLGGARVLDLGGWDAPRLQAGRYRRLHEEYWVDWEEFRSTPGQRFRAEPDLAAWYSQACGLAHRWMDGSDGERKVFVEYLVQVLMDNGAAAAAALGNEETIRTAYDRYLQESWKREARNRVPRPYFPSRTEAILCRCDVDVPSLLAWDVGYKKSPWIDLSFTRLDDAWLEPKNAAPWDVEKLYLEDTRTTDAAMPAIGNMKSLVQLDLSHCPITDAGLVSLSKHATLKQLWLTGTQVTDASIEVLASLPRLESIAIDGTAITEEGWQSLKKKKPHLKR
ncbi:MAG: leucine-rich repeat domain-containing protein [Pirellula sp.]